jgi:hypothetical protein
MKIIDLFDIYFLILMIIEGLIVAIIDSYTFKKLGKAAAAKKAKILGISALVISVVLFTIRVVV